jgi:PKD repeat protein
MNYWYFGSYAGLVFDSSGVQAINGNLHIPEGSAAISDGCGLLFYTDGDTVWNKNHQMMNNGFGLGANCLYYGGGTPSSTQSSLIVRQPQSDSIYYVFTTDCLEDTFASGLRYSIINMNMNNGLGEVVIKAQPLYPFVEEKLTASKHANGCDIWIISHESGTNNFVSFLLTNVGLTLTPVVSATGQIHFCSSQLAGRGYLKASPNGEKLINVNPEGAMIGCDTISPELFNFDKLNGTVSSYLVFPPDTSYSMGAVWSIPFYGASFSPDNSKLYLSSGWFARFLFQYDLNAGSISNILLSRTLIDTTLHFFTAIANAPDGKTFVSKVYELKLGAINNPDSLGLNCNYVDTFINTNNLYYGGLPNFFEDYLNPKSLRADFSFSQSNDTIYFTNNSIAGNSFSWNFGDASTSNLQTPFHVYADTGFYTVILTARDTLCNMDKKCYTVYVSSTTGINDLENDNQLSISPNPFSEFLNLKVNGYQQFEILIYDIASRKLLQQTFASSITLNTKRFPKGMYLYEVRNSSGLCKKGKVVKD